MACKQSKFQPHRITSGEDCFLHVVAIILLSDPYRLAAPTKTAASCGLGARGGRAEGGHICLLCIWRALRVYVSKQLTERETQRATSASTGLCRPDHKQSLPSLETVESINKLSCFGQKRSLIVHLSACEC